MDFNEFADIIRNVFNSENIEVTMESIRLNIPDIEDKYFTISSSLNNYMIKTK